MEAIRINIQNSLDYLNPDRNNNFSISNKLFKELTEELSSTKCRNMDFSNLESLIEIKGREVLRNLLEEHLKSRGNGHIGAAIEGKDGKHRGYKKNSIMHITSIFGKVKNNRLMYYSPGLSAIFPKDASLNLPKKTYSHQLTKRACKEIAKNSYDLGIDSIRSSTGVNIGKRQLEELSIEGAKDFNDFYNHPCTPETIKELESSDLIVLTCDSKGIVVRKEDLKEATKKKAEQETGHKLQKRLSKGEKKNCKRMATVAAVYNNNYYQRTPDEVMKSMSKNESAKRLRPIQKRVWASLKKEQPDVIKDMFLEACNRDPERNKEWVCLVDGEPRQINNIENEAKKRKVHLTIVLDIIHVIEYIWKASRAFFGESSYQCEIWANDKIYQILQGKSEKVTKSLKYKCNKMLLKGSKKEAVENCICYLTKKSKYLHYNEYLEKGYPIGTGVIEGACRHLIKDRMDLTGARWSLDGAEAVLKLRSLLSSGDFEEYWLYHEEEEYLRNYNSQIGDVCDSKQRGKNNFKLVKEE